MSALRTALAFGTFRRAGRTARHTADLSALAHEQDLRARGWINPAAPPWERRAAVDTLNAQAVARADIVNEANGARPSRYLIVGAVAFFGFVYALLRTLGAALGDTPNWGAAVAAWLIATAAVVAAYLLVHRSERRRTAVLADAVEHDGYCGWCGAPAPHRLEGVPTAPRVYHAVDIRDSLS